MASTNGATPRDSNSEHTPLLGRPVPEAAEHDRPLLKNLVTGTAPLAQAGSIVLFLLIWGGVFTHKTITFSAHPLLNAVGLLFATQAVLILQPTHTPDQKRNGTLLHASFWAVALGSFYAGLGVVEWHKKRNHIGHFESPHATLGIIIYVLLLLQAFVGVTQYFFPGIYGGVDNGKALYKYHRVAGYVILLLILINVILATRTYYAGKILGIKTWGTVLGSFFVIIGVGPRVRKQKVKLWNRQ